LSGGGVGGRGGGGSAFINAPADHIISTIREDNVVENAKKKDKTNTIKDLLIQQNIRTEGKKNLINKQITVLRTDMKTEIQSSIRDLLEQNRASD
jgi:hypothetical protein